MSFTLIQLLLTIRQNMAHASFSERFIANSLIAASVECKEKKKKKT